MLVDFSEKQQPRQRIDEVRPPRRECTVRVNFTVPVNCREHHRLPSALTKRRAKGTQAQRQGAWRLWLKGFREVERYKLAAADAREPKWVPDSKKPARKQWWIDGRDYNPDAEEATRAALLIYLGQARLVDLGAPEWEFGKALLARFGVKNDQLAWRVYEDMRNDFFFPERWQGFFKYARQTSRSARPKQARERRQDRGREIVDQSETAARRAAVQEWERREKEIGE